MLKSVLAAIAGAVVLISAGSAEAKRYSASVAGDCFKMKSRPVGNFCRFSSGVERLAQNNQFGGGDYNSGIETGSAAGISGNGLGAGAISPGTMGTK